MTFRIEVCAERPSFADEVVTRTLDAARAAGVESLVEVVAHDHTASGLAVALVAASDTDAGPQLRRCVTEALDREQPVIPVIDNGLTWQGRLPQVLEELNAISLADAASGRKILESAGVLVPLRGVFLSHRRSDGGAMAIQLAAAFRANGLATFVDVLDIAPSEAVQERIISSLDQMACLVILESPDAIQSDWVTKEVVYAQERHLGTLSLCWAPENEPKKPPSRFSEFDSGNRVDVRPYLRGIRPSQTLSDTGVTTALAAILREFVQALYFRRANLEREVLAAAPAIERRAPWRYVLKGQQRSRLVGLTPYRPDALDLYALAVERKESSVDDAVLVHSPITEDTAEALMLTWIGQKGPELTLNTERLDELFSGLS